MVAPVASDGLFAGCTCGRCGAWVPHTEAIHTGRFGAVCRGGGCFGAAPEPVQPAARAQPPRKPKADWLPPLPRDRGRPPALPTHCPGCERAVPAGGWGQVGHWPLCDDCTAEAGERAALLAGDDGVPRAVRMGRAVGAE